MIRKLLISLIFCVVSDTALADELIKPDGEIDNVLITLYRFETKQAMFKHFEGMDDPPDTSGPDWEMEGYSLCWRNLEMNIAYCDIFLVNPREVDGEHTLTLGHEVLHGVFGDRYHD